MIKYLRKLLTLYVICIQDKLLFKFVRFYDENVYTKNGFLKLY